MSSISSRSHNLHFKCGKPTERSLVKERKQNIIKSHQFVPAARVIRGSGDAAFQLRSLPLRWHWPPFQPLFTILLFHSMSPQAHSLWIARSLWMEQVGLILFNPKWENPLTTPSKSHKVLPFREKCALLSMGARKKTEREERSKK